MPFVVSSLIAQQVYSWTEGKKTFKRCTVKPTLRKVFGVCLHTTGSGVPTKAKNTGRRTIDVAMASYFASQCGSNGYFWGGPHYVIDHDGAIYQIADDNVVTAHCGGSFRSIYLNGTWVNRAPARAVAEWHRQWPTYKSPQHLFPSKSPNTDFIGVEMIPCIDGLGKPWEAGLRFTESQHKAARDLVDEIGMRWGFPIDWRESARLLGHEDLQPILYSASDTAPGSKFGRSDKGGGWDPGNLREAPYFDFGFVRG